MGHQYEMAYGGSIGYLTDDATWHWKVKVVNQIYSDANISKKVADRDCHSVPVKH